MNVKRLIILCILIVAMTVVPTVSAQSPSTSGEYEGVIESLSGKWAIISGLKFHVKNAQLDDDIDRLRVGLEVRVAFVIRDGIVRATYIDDDDDDINGVGRLSGVITAKTGRYIVISGVQIFTRGATIEGDADYRVNGRVKVEFYPKSQTTLRAYNIDDD